MYSDWVFDRVKNFCHVVGLSCEGFEDQMLALFTTIKANRYQASLGSDPKCCYKLVNRGNRELKMLICSVNFDMKGGHSNRGKGKGRGSNS